MRVLTESIKYPIARTLGGATCHEHPLGGGGGETSEPTEFVGGWDGVASIDFEARDVGFGRIQLIVEGGSFGADGAPITTDHSALMTRSMWRRSHRLILTCSLPVRSVEDGSLYVGDLIRPLLSDAELYGGYSALGHTRLVH